MVWGGALAEDAPGSQPTPVIPGPRSGTRNPPVMRDARLKLRRRAQSWILGSLNQRPGMTAMDFDKERAQAPIFSISASDSVKLT
ncbi:hypothetical protein JCM2811A_05670 [Methylorubrum rhodinum]